MIMQNSRWTTFGWASFEVKHHEKEVEESQLGDDPFPPISGMTSKDVIDVSKNFQGKKSYSSVTRSLMNFTALPITSNCHGRRGMSSANYLEKNKISPLQYSYVSDNRVKIVPREDVGGNGLEAKNKKINCTVKTPNFTTQNKEHDSKGNDDLYGIYRKDAIKMRRYDSFWTNSKKTYRIFLY